MIIRGRLHATMHQFCNDWISYDADDGTNGIIGPLSVRLEGQAEAQLFIDAPSPGTFWEEFELTPDFRFRRVRVR